MYLTEKDKNRMFSFFRKKENIEIKERKHMIKGSSRRLEVGTSIILMMWEISIDMY